MRLLELRSLIIFLFSLLLFGNIAYSQVDLNNGLVAYYPFSGNANDASGNGNNGAATSVTLTTDRSGVANSAYYFNGTNASILLPYSALYNFSPSGTHSISLWVQPDINPNWTAQALVVKSPPNSNYLQSQWNYGAYLVNRAAMAGYADNHVVTGTTVLNTNQCWYNITYTYDNGKWHVYVNGILESSDLTQTKFALQDGAASRIAFGKKGESSGDYYKGKMDEVRIYNRVLNQQEITVLSQQPAPCLPNCSNWLNLPSQPSWVNIGDLDITGDKLTIEAEINIKGVPPGGVIDGLDIVSKHTGPSNANYLFRSTHAEITTTNGFFSTPIPCAIEMNKTYHVAMVYDGSFLKYYRNGFLMAQTPCTGNMIQNNFPTGIGFISTLMQAENFIGYINEVRIWNVARTQAELRTYMNTSLPSPITQTGLLAYYAFDNLINKQGNPAWNGTLIGAAAINQTNPECTFVADSCAVDSIIINKYTEVLRWDDCDNVLDVSDASEFMVGDTILMIQMQGAIIDSTNTAVFGTVRDYRNAGNYEFNYIKSKNGNRIELLNKLKRQYDLPGGKVQLIRVPYFQNYTTTEILTCLPWDGSKGGVLAFNVQNNLILNQNIDVSGKGFRGGAVLNNSIVTCNQQDYFYSPASNNGGEKGEGVHQLSVSKNYGRGSPSNAGGGGNAHNAGGGGGANAGAGGNGGDQWEGCKNITENIGGKGGKALQNSAALNKLYMGGGGGMGHGNDRNEFPAGNGGGIIIISANSITSNGNYIRANGDEAVVCGGSGDCNDGMSGGGAGGTILLDIASFNGSSEIEAKGGRGANSYYLHPVDVNNKVGPGGGGGGGFIAIKQPAVSSQMVPDVSGGSNGVLLNHNNNPFGATAGGDGVITTSVDFFIDNEVFKPNIDSIRISNEKISCNEFNFKGLSYTNTSPIVSWLWSFGNADFSSQQNTTYTYPVGGAYDVKLVGIDADGCMDSTTIQLKASIPAFSVSNDTTICKNTPVQLFASGGVTYNWTPSGTLNNGSLSNPVASPVLDTTIYYVAITDNNDCSYFDSVTVYIQPPPVFSINNPVQVCLNDSVQLTASGGDLYSWQAENGLGNTSIANPRVSPAVNTTYTVTITETICNESTTLSTDVTVLPLPVVQATKSNDIDCSNDQSQLSASGAVQYNWTPSADLSNSTIENPVARPAATTQFIVKGTDANGCHNYDSVMVNVDNVNRGGYLMPTAFTPNNDGLNDCYGIRFWGVIQEVDFSIYNRWGQRIFYTKDPFKCWDGTYRGVKQGTDVFVYVIKAKTSCDDSVFRKGTFTLIR